MHYNTDYDIHFDIIVSFFRSSTYSYTAFSRECRMKKETEKSEKTVKTEVRAQGGLGLTFLDLGVS
jgi:hypothetical protein